MTCRNHLSSFSTEITLPASLERKIVEPPVPHSKTKVFELRIFLSSRLTHKTTMEAPFPMDYLKNNNSLSIEMSSMAFEEDNLLKDEPFWDLRNTLEF